MRKNILKWLLFSMVVVLSTAGLTQPKVYADDTTVKTDVVITKVETEDQAKDMNLEDLANGVDVSDYFTDGKVLPGVSFTYFKVEDKDKFEDMVNNPSNFDTTDKVGEFLDGQNGIKTEETDENGQVTLEDLIEGVYWVVENTKGTIQSSQAVPFGLTLPFTNLNGDGYLEKVYVYPKNVLEDPSQEIEKDVDESNVAIGQLNTWTIGIAIPNGIEDYKEFGFVDEIDERLDFEGLDSVVVSADGNKLLVNEDYIVTFTEGGTGTYGKVEGKNITGTLSLHFTELGRTKLGEVDDEKVEIRFETKVNKKAIMGLEIYNQAYLEFDNGHGVKHDPDNPPKTEEPEVHTGGHAFKKVDNSKNESLEGAEFKVMVEQGKYVKVESDGSIKVDSEGSVVYVSKDEATVFTSNSNGLFEVIGLPYGDYILVETKAPKGYALPTNPETNFEISKDSYYNDPTQVELGDPADKIFEINNKKITIPQTGGIGTFVFSFSGLALMLFAVAYHRKTQES